MKGAVWEKEEAGELLKEAADHAQGSSAPGRPSLLPRHPHGSGHGRHPGHRGPLPTRRLRPSPSGSPALGRGRAADSAGLAAAWAPRAGSWHSGETPLRFRPLLVHRGFVRSPPGPSPERPPRPEEASGGPRGAGFREATSPRPETAQRRLVSSVATSVWLRDGPRARHNFPGLSCSEEIPFLQGKHSGTHEEDAQAALNHSARFHETVDTKGRQEREQARVPSARRRHKPPRRLCRWDAPSPQRKPPAGPARACLGPLAVRQRRRDVLAPTHFPRTAPRSALPRERPARGAWSFVNVGSGQRASEKLQGRPALPWLAVRSADGTGKT